MGDFGNVKLFIPLFNNLRKILAGDVRQDFHYVEIKEI